MRAPGPREYRLHGQIGVRRNDAQRRELDWRRRASRSTWFTALMMRPASSKPRSSGCKALAAGSFSRLRYELRMFSSILPAYDAPKSEARPKSFRCTPHSSIERCLVGSHQAAAALNEARRLAHCSSDNAAMLGRMSVRNGARCSASRQRSCTISKGMRASTSA